MKKIAALLLFISSACGAQQIASTNATGPAGSVIGYNAAGHNWLYVPVDANGYLLVDCPDCAGTLPSVTAAQPTVGSAVGVLTSSPLFLDAAQFAGSNAGQKINACTSALITAGGGQCDLRAVLSGGTVATSEVEIGDTTQTEIKTSYVLPDAITLTITFNDSTKCGIHIYSGATIEGSATGGGGNGAHVFAGSGSTMKSLLCTDQVGFPFNSYFKVGNIALYNQSGATMSSGYLATLTDGVDQSHFHDIFALNETGNSILINNTCCGAKYERLQGFASPGGVPFAVGGIPITVGLVGGSMQAVTISDSTANAPISGQPNWKINIGDGLTMLSDYAEGNGATDTATPMVYIGSNVNNVNFLGGIIQPLCASACAGKYSFESHSTGSVNILGTTIGPSGQGAFLNDVAGGNVYPGNLSYQGNTLSLGPEGVNGGINPSGNFDCSLCMGKQTGFFSEGSAGSATDILMEIAGSFIIDFEPTLAILRPGVQLLAQNGSFTPDIGLFHDSSKALWDVGASGQNTDGGFALKTIVYGTTFTVSTLPSASSSGAGATVMVTDATTFTPGACTGGGSDYVIAISNGTSWSCH